MKWHLIADVDPLAQVRIPLRAGAGAADGATQTGASYPYGAAANSAAANGAATDSATATAGTTAANGTATNGATATTSTGAAATTTAAAAAAAPGLFYVLAKRGVFPIEDVKGRQTDIRDFLVAQNKLPCVVL